MNEQNTPFGFFPGNPGPGGFPPRQQCNCTNEIRNLNNRINNIEREINRLDRRIRRLEFGNRPSTFGPVSTQTDFTSSYDNENYII